MDWKNFVRRAFHRAGLFLLFLATLMFLLGALGDTLGLSNTFSLILLGFGFGTFTAWLTWSSTGQGAPTFTKMRVFNYTGVPGVPVESVKTERKEPPLPASPPPPTPPEIDNVPPMGPPKTLEAPPGIPFYAGVKAVTTTIRIEGVDHSFDHEIQPSDYPTDRVMFQQIIVAPGGGPNEYIALSTLFHLADTDETVLRWSESTFNLT